MKRIVRKLPDAKHPIWPILTGLLVMAGCALLLWANYNHFDPPRDLQTVVEVGAIYFAANLGKRSLHNTKTKHAKAPA